MSDNRAMRIRLWLPLLVLTVSLLLPAAASAAAKPWIAVSGNQLVDRDGQPVRLLGVNRSGTEYRCVRREGIFEGPTDWASIQAMKRWRINVVRIPLNESCWLGINGVQPAFGGDIYRAAIRSFVDALQRAGLYVILELHWAAPGTQPAFGLLPLPDADHAPDFWRSVAAEFRNNRGVLFDLFNEPRPGVSWDCWEWGCEIDNEWVGRYTAVGMRQLVRVVRSAGARQPLLLGGVQWARDLSGWLSHRPPDPLRSLVASNHTYNTNPCYARCRGILARIARRFPVVTGELGQIDCRHNYVDSYMRWADKHGVSYLGWAWNTGNGWTCRSGPTLIRNYEGAPTGFGIGFREHLRTQRPSYHTKRPGPGP